MTDFEGIAELRSAIEFARARSLTAWENYIELRAIESEATELWSSLILTADHNSPAEIDLRIDMVRTVEALGAYNLARELHLQLGAKLKRLEAGQS